MPDDGRSREELAVLLGYERRACERCSTQRDSACANCEGTGHVWVSNHSSLSDSGLDRLAALLPATGRKDGEP